MNRSFAIPLMLIYLAFSAGLVIDYHFCNGKLDQISLVNSNENCCPNDTLEKNCCLDTSQVFNVIHDYDSNVSRTGVSEVKLTSLIQPTFPVIASITSGKIKIQMFDSSTIKHFCNVPIYLINQTFII